MIMEQKKPNLRCNSEYKRLYQPITEQAYLQLEAELKDFTDIVDIKSWLFSNTQNGVMASALIYSLAVTACANAMNVEEYFYRLLTSDVPIMPWDE